MYGVGSVWLRVWADLSFSPGERNEASLTSTLGDFFGLTGHIANQ